MNTYISTKQELEEIIQQAAKSTCATKFSGKQAERNTTQ